MTNIITVIFLFTGILLSAQSEKKHKQENVPSLVRQTFEKEFPNTKATWDIEKEMYEAEFEQNGVATSATYNKAGFRLEFETEIQINKLPKAALLYLNKNFPAQKIQEASKILDKKNILTYEAEIKKNGKTVEMLFDSKGNFLK